MASMAVPGSAVSVYNNDPGSGRTGYWEIPPNNYDFYCEDEKYKPLVQADGGILSSARPARRQAARAREARRCARRPGGRGLRPAGSPGLALPASRRGALSAALRRLGADVRAHEGAGGRGPAEGVRKRRAARCGAAR